MLLRISSKHASKWTLEFSVMQNIRATSYYNRWYFSILIAWNFFNAALPSFFFFYTIFRRTCELYGKTCRIQAGKREREKGRKKESFLLHLRAREMGARLYCRYSRSRITETRSYLPPTAACLQRGVVTLIQNDIVTLRRKHRTLIESWLRYFNSVWWSACVSHFDVRLIKYKCDLSEDTRYLQWRWDKSTSFAEGCTSYWISGSIWLVHADNVALTKFNRWHIVNLININVKSPQKIFIFLSYHNL